MFKEKRVGVVIAAGGSGTRFGGDTPKQFLKINKMPILGMTTQKFLKNDFVDEIVIAVSNDYLSLAREIVDELKPVKPVSFASGGRERQDSVYEALKSLNCDLVLVHDAARPFVSGNLISKLTEEAYLKGAAIPALSPKDTVRTESETLKRSELYLVQTPQAFDFVKLKDAYEKAFMDGFLGTDDASIYERVFAPPAIVPGEYENIKITTKEDLKVEKQMLFGHGFDVHKLVEGRKCILLGSEIPYEKGLLGHSDADVATHALMDAILGATGLGDIGKHFPDTDDAYEGISSILLLKRVKSLIDDMNLAVANCDITIICERPKVLPYVETMKKNVADALLITPERVNVKGTTTEKLGFTGRGEGIAALATALLYTK